MLISTVFVFAVVILCVKRPNAGRIFLGIFFLVMAIAVNGIVTFTHSQAYVEYADGAMIPLYRDIALAVVKLNPVVFGIFLMIFEIAMGLLLLYKKRSVKIGLIGTMLFLIAIAPLSFLQMPWLGLIIGEAYILPKEFETSFMEMLHPKLGNNQL